MSIDRSIALINKLDSIKFGKFIERVVIKLPLVHGYRAQDLFSFDEREKLLTVFGLESQSDLTSILDWCVEILQTAGFEQCQLDALRDKLLKAKLNQDQVDVVVGVWTAHGKAFIDRLKSRTLGVNQLVDVGYVLNVDVASESRARVNQPTSYLQLNVDKAGGGTEKMAFELDHAQLLNLYNKLEDIQKQLDTLTG